MKNKFILIVLINSLILISCKTPKSESGSLIQKETTKDTTKNPSMQENDSLINLHNEEMKKGEKDITLDQKKQYNSKSGVIEMTSTMIAGMKQTIYFDDYGSKRATYIEAPSTEGVKTSRTAIIEDKGYITVYDLDSKDGNKALASEAQIGVIGTTSYVASNLTPEIIKEFDVKSIEDFTVLDKKCKGYKVIGASGLDNVNAWLFDGIPMRIEIDMGNKVIFEAKSLETDITITSENFLIPKSVKLK
jgi:hypothetical protein